MSDRTGADIERRNGFTIVEVLVSAAIAVMVMTVTLSIFITTMQFWNGIDLRMDAARAVNLAMSRMVYGMDDRLGIRSAANVVLTPGEGGWSLSYVTGGVAPQTNAFTYSQGSRTIMFMPGDLVVGADISYANAIVSARSVVVTLRVDRAIGGREVRRQIGSEISWRN